jgi:hypothetical protein
MNIVLDDAEEVLVKKDERRSVGKQIIKVYS